jgi:hypothetical protein
MSSVRLDEQVNCPLDADGILETWVVNTIARDYRILQIEKSRWRNKLAGCTVRVYEHLDGSVVVRFGPHEVARWAPGSLPASQPKVRKGARPLGRQRQAA